MSSENSEPDYFADGRAAKLFFLRTESNCRSLRPSWKLGASEVGKSIVSENRRLTIGVLKRFSCSLSGATAIRRLLLLSYMPT